MTFHMFEGSSAYELQIGKLVLQVPYTWQVQKRGNTTFVSAYRYSWLCRNFGLHVWIDPYGKWV